jgi:predicted  nucleic acid-binding Zn-ribbon protein
MAQKKTVAHGDLPALAVSPELEATRERVRSVTQRHDEHAQHLRHMREDYVADEQRRFTDSRGFLVLSPELRTAEADVTRLEAELRQAQADVTRLEAAAFEVVRDEVVAKRAQLEATFVAALAQALTAQRALRTFGDQIRRTYGAAAMSVRPAAGLLDTTLEGLQQRLALVRNPHLSKAKGRAA